MSLKDRFVDGVSSLFDRLNDGEELGGVRPEALERELFARTAQRKKDSGAPSDNPITRLAGAGEEARGKREKLSSDRVAKLRSRRKAKDAKEKKERDAAFRHMEEEARRNPPPRQAPPRSSSSSSSQRRGPRRPSIFQNKDLAEHYKVLEVEYGADEATVKKAYRSLMRKYHPDRHRDPKKKKAATQLAVKISAAYEAITDSRK